MKQLVRGASAGLLAAGVAVAAVKLNGLNGMTYLGMLYLYVVLGAGLKFSPDLPDLLHRLVVVTEGEVIEMRKLATGEKYKIKGEVEKLQ